MFLALFGRAVLSLVPALFPLVLSWWFGRGVGGHIFSLSIGLFAVVCNEQRASRHGTDRQLANKKHMCVNQLRLPFLFFHFVSFSVVVVISVQFHTMILLDSSSWVKCISRHSSLFFSGATLAHVAPLPGQKVAAPNTPTTTLLFLRSAQASAWLRSRRRRRLGKSVALPRWPW